MSTGKILPWYSSSIGGFHSKGVPPLIFGELRPGFKKNQQIFIVNQQSSFIFE